MSYVIGDIHGEYEKLKQLVKIIPKQEKLIFIGDYINKGRDSKKVVDYLIQLKKKREVIFLIGNHEFKLLEAWRGHRPSMEYLKEMGFLSTLESYLGKKLNNADFIDQVNQGQFKTVMDGHYEFFANLGKFYQEDRYFIVHAGIPVDRLGRFCLRPLEKMVFIRKRYLKTKKRFRNKIVICGHTAFKEVFWDGFKLGIDTGAVYSRKNGYGRLTAVDLERFECVDNLGRRYKPVLSNLEDVYPPKTKWNEL